MAVAVPHIQLADVPEPNRIKDAKQSGRRSVKSKRNATEKERLCLQTEEIVRGHILGSAQGHQFSAIRRCCVKVVEDHEAKLLQLCKKLKPSRESLHGNFVRVFGNLFSGGVTVGKILTSIAFSGKLVEYCTENDLGVTDNLIAWTLDYFKLYLADWILNYGGWEKIEQKLADGQPPKIQWSAVVLDTLTFGISVFTNYL